MEKINRAELEKVKQAYKELYEAFQKFTEVVSDEYVNDLEACSIYPFDRDFDELTLGVAEWVADALEELGEM